MQSLSPIQYLIQSRCTALQISYKQLVARTGYSNVSVGLKRLNQLFNADYKSSKGLIEKIAPVLNLTPVQIHESILETKRQQALEADKAYRSSFKPNFVIRTSNRGRPKQIFIASLLNASQYVHKLIPDDVAVADYIEYAFNSFRTHQNCINNFFDAPVDIVINYSPDSAEVVSLTGAHIEYLDKSVLLGTISHSLRNKNEI